MPGISDRSEHESDRNEHESDRSEHELSNTILQPTLMYVDVSTEHALLSKMHLYRLTCAPMGIIEMDLAKSKTRYIDDIRVTSGLSDNVNFNNVYELHVYDS